MFSLISLNFMTHLTRILIRPVTFEDSALLRKY